jgi:hypothetical protein
VALKHRLYAGGATRVMKTTDNEFALQPSGERLIGLTELC